MATPGLQGRLGRVTFTLNDLVSPAEFGILLLRKKERTDIGESSSRLCHND